MVSQSLLVGRARTNEKRNGHFIKERERQRVSPTARDDDANELLDATFGTTVREKHGFFLG
jgi:hypothetical protein